MGIADVNPKLASNRMIFEIRRDVRRIAAFRADIEGTMAKYGLSDVEKAAWRAIDIKKLAELGVHPYFLPQISRLFEGGAYNHNNSNAARLYAKNLVEPAQ